ncbi:MAG: Catechol 2,3-dioxygenase [Candidatus Methanomarinus sp.]|nr:MAG: Catechol 2,3-dioxygenase [ANME-2 cluster archaeon]
MEMKKIAPNFAVQDIEKTVTFYRDVLGFKLEMAVSEDKSGVEQEFYIKDCNGYIL